MATSPEHDASYGPREREPRLPRWLLAIWGVSLTVLLVLAGVMVGVMLERDRYDDAVVLGGEWDELGAVVDHLERDSYYRPSAEEAVADWQATLEREAIAGLLRGSGDDHAAFLPPAEAARSAAALTGEYEGIGVSIAENHRGEIEVVSIMLESPAQRADVRVGDVIEAVEATPIPTNDLETAAELLRGSAGTDVTVAFSRPGGDAYELTLTREKISTGETTVSYRTFPDHDLAVVGISLFALTTGDELDAVLAQARHEGVTRIVLDLRGNPGGWVSEAQRVLGRFIDPGAGPALLEDTWPAGGGMVPLPIEGEDAERFEGGLVVLVDEHSASASEIVAAALRHYERAIVVGETTFGKGSVQRVYDLDSGESLRLTVATWFSPGEEPLEGVGVEPEVVVDVARPLDELVRDLAPLFEPDGSHPVRSASPVASPVAVATPAP